MAEPPSLQKPSLPKWELGLGGAGLSTPAYKGSAKQRFWVAPLPYFVYRGEVLKADKEGLRADLLDSKNWRLSLSAGAGLPVLSEGTAREGMDDLAPTVELGAVLKRSLTETEPDAKFKGAGAWRLELPLRYAIALRGRGKKALGWVASPGLHGEGRVQILNSNWNWGADVNTHWQSRGYNDYYYTVHQKDALTTAAHYRPEYHSGSGYAGVSASVSLGRRQGNWIMGAVASVSNINGAAFSDSPLVERKTNYALGMLLIYVMKESSDRVVDAPLTEGAAPKHD